MNASFLTGPIMFATEYWGAPAFVKIIPTGNNFDVQVNDEHLAFVSYGDKEQLEDVDNRFWDNDLLDQISKHIKACLNL